MQSTIAFDSDTGSSSNPVYTTTFTYGASGQLTSVDIGDGRPRTITFTNDMNGQVDPPRRGRLAGQRRSARGLVPL